MEESRHRAKVVVDITDHVRIKLGLAVIEVEVRRMVEVVIGIRILLSSIFSTAPRFVG